MAVPCIRFLLRLPGTIIIRGFVYLRALQGALNVFWLDLGTDIIDSILNYLRHHGIHSLSFRIPQMNVKNIKSDFSRSSIVITPTCAYGRGRAQVLGQEQPAVPEDLRARRVEVLRAQRALRDDVTDAPTRNTNGESYRFCVLGRSQSEYFMVFFDQVCRFQAEQAL